MQVMAMAPDPWPHLAVVESRRNPHLELDAAALTFDHAHDLARSGVARVLPYDHAVQELELALRALERRLQDERVSEVLARDLPVVPACRGDRAMPAPLVVEQPRERAAGVKPRQAAPVD